ncbi:hypothetical protein [Candidatus Amarolinea dominans]|uniref:hypothetical protein n=1 Tax=Candidatus Amarolinea dominans TaxID=3140696 RepID=UPI001D67A3D8|nr:hypothetical protein [Anaerolineae bacterium]
MSEKHLARMAYVYIRQSTLQQVVRNPESQVNQRQMVGRAIGLGWSAERIEVKTKIKGRSGSDSAKSGADSSGW